MLRRSSLHHLELLRPNFLFIEHPFLPKPIQPPILRHIHYSKPSPPLPNSLQLVLICFPILRTAPTNSGRERWKHVRSLIRNNQYKLQLNCLLLMEYQLYFLLFVLVLLGLLWGGQGKGFI